MRVKVRGPYSGSECERDLEHVLAPTSCNHEGRLESLGADVEANSKAIGRLLAHLVESNTLTLEKACEIAGVYSEVTPLTPDEQAGRVTSRRVRR